MKEKVRATPEAMERIRQFGEAKIHQFLDEVSLGSVKGVVEFLPAVPGFRPQSEAGIKQQKLGLAKRLSNKSGTDRDFFALYVMWRAWAWEQLGDPDAVEHLLDDLESAITQPASGNDNAGENPRAATLTFLSALKQLSVENKCSREKISRLAEFSPLSIDDAGQQIIHSSKSAAEIERDKTISDLPNRLRADEAELQTLKSRFQSLSADVGAAVEKAGLVENKAERHSQSLHLLSEAIERINHSLTAIEKTNKQDADALLRLEKRADELAGQSRASASRQDESDAHLRSTTQTIHDAMGQIRQAVEALQYKLSGISPASTEAVESIAKEIQDLRATALAIPQGSSREEIEALDKRLLALELPAPSYEASHAATTAPDSYSVSVVSRGVAPGATVQRLDEAKKIVGVLSERLQSIGLKKSSVLLLAEEITAAIVTGQAVTFKGAFAHLVASKCAETLGNGDVWNISVPIGLPDGRSLAAAFDLAVSKSSAHIPSVVIEGLNRSALDSTKDTILAFTADYIINGTPPVFCFISLVAGVASLPVEPEHLELGPVLDLDYLDWRLSPGSGTGTAYGSVTPAAIATARSKLAHGAGDGADDTLRVLRTYMPKRNPRIERAVANAFAALTALRQPRADASVQQSLAYGWLVPLCVASGLSKSDTDSELDGGKCDQQKADPRVAAMLDRETFGPEKSEGDK